MNDHPNREELAKYICAESSAAEAQMLKAHLGKCGDCSQTLEEWKGTLRKLDAWQLPRKGNKATRTTWVRYAAAACVLLGLGFGLGRYSVPPGLNKEDVASMIAADKAETYKDFVVALETARIEDRQLTGLLIDEVRTDQTYKFVQLRKDLETVAAGTDAGLRATQRGLMELSAYKQQ